METARGQLNQPVTAFVAPTDQQGEILQITPRGFESAGERTGNPVATCPGIVGLLRPYWFRMAIALAAVVAEFEALDRLMKARRRS